MKILKSIIIALALSAALVAPTVMSSAPAAAISRCFASPVYDRAGPGLKNWRAYDPYCNGGGGVGKWWGPWRYTKSGALIDAEQHNAWV